MRSKLFVLIAGMVSITLFFGFLLAPAPPASTVYELKVQLAVLEKQQIEKTGTENAEAYRLYLLGKNQLNKKTAESIFKGIEYFNDAIEIDPDYALPYVGIADCYTLIGGTGYGSFSREGAINLAKNAVNKALKIDNTLADAYNSLAYLQFRLEWDWTAAESNFKKAIKLSNSRLITISALGSVYSMAGLNEEALKIYSPLVNLSNEKYVSPFYFGIIDAALGNYDNALDSLYKSYDEHFGILVYIKASPIYNNLKSEQRFAKLMQMIGLEK